MRVEHRKVVLKDLLWGSDGVPLASAYALYGPSKPAVWWLRLGIRLERIAPGYPEQNDRNAFKSGT